MLALLVTASVRPQTRMSIAEHDCDDGRVYRGQVHAKALAFGAEGIATWLVLTAVKALHRDQTVQLNTISAKHVVPTPIMNPAAKMMRKSITWPALRRLFRPW